MGFLSALADSDRRRRQHIVTVCAGIDALIRARQFDAAYRTASYHIRNGLDEPELRERLLMTWPAR